ncbi:MAG: hypothetical protein QOE70_6682 [Chthoniobacter sp.]|jgi:ankyrin repeat protein|nr:hypothetical protein [Chthoniobacter sp.]
MTEPRATRSICSQRAISLRNWRLALLLLALVFRLETAGAEGPARGNLLRAVSSGDIDRAKSLLREGADPNEYDRERWSPLTAAAVRGDVDATVALLKAGARVDWRNDLGRTPLMLAAWRGHGEVMRKLLEAGADPKARSKGRWTPLMFAADGRQPAAVAQLLERGADVRVRGREFTSPIELACRGGDSKVIELLIRAGADVDSRSGWSGGTMLAIAAQNGHLAAVETLLRLGANVSLSGSQYNTPLHNAIQRRNSYDDPNIPKMVALLLKAGARPTQVDLTTATYHERRSDRHELTDLLLQAGANLNERDGVGWNALHHAVLNGATAIVQRLLEAGADINALDEFHRSPLTLAAQRGDAPMVAFLLGHGAPIEDPANPDRTPLYAAAEAGHVAIVRALVAAGANGSSPDSARALFITARRLEVRTVEALLEAGADPNYEQNGWTPLAIALGDPQPRGELLVEGKPDPIRVRAATESLTRRFLAAPTLSQASRDNALVHASDRQPLNIVQWLVEAGADPSAADQRWGTPGQLARSNPDPQVAAFLRQHAPK